MWDEDGVVRLGGGKHVESEYLLPGTHWEGATQLAWTGSARAQPLWLYSVVYLPYVDIYLPTHSLLFFVGKSY